MQAPSATDGLVVCRQCQRSDLQDLGPIAVARIFAGQPLQPPWPGGRLYQCRHCQLGFRHPVHSDEDYGALYEQAEGDVWLADRLRVDQALVRDAVLAPPRPQRVLDVGCYDGTLLAALGPEVATFGVEASRAAADMARSRGVSIVAPRVADLASHEGRYDAITAVDVIEHLTRPDRFLALLARCLAPGGRLIVSTGSLDSPAWQRSGGRYWYCQFPEHIAFVSPAWAEALAPTLGLRLTQVTRFAYLSKGPWWRLRHRWRFERKHLQARWRGGDRIDAVGEPGVFEDHVLLVFEPAVPDVRATRSA